MTGEHGKVLFVSVCVTGEHGEVLFVSLCVTGEHGKSAVCVCV